MTLSDQIARIEARGVELDPVRVFAELVANPTDDEYLSFPTKAAMEAAFKTLLTALDEATAESDRMAEAAMEMENLYDEATAAIERLRGILVQSWYDHEYLWAKVAQESPDGTVEAWAKRGEA
jgi:hypothetical protein